MNTKMVWVYRFTEKNAGAEHLGYRIKRICHKDIAEKLVVEVELFNRVENGGHIEKQGAENFVKIFDILEENFKCAEYKTYTQRENQQNDDRHGSHKNVGVDYGRLIREEIEIKNEAYKYGKRNDERYEV